MQPANLSRRNLDLLTPREAQVCALIASGRLNKQIAALIGTTEVTVKVHRARVMHKMGVQSVAELVRLVDVASIAADAKWAVADVTRAHSGATFGEKLRRRLRLYGLLFKEAFDLPGLAPWTRKSRRIATPPGVSLLRLARTVFGKDACERIFDCEIADLQLEYIDALGRGRKWEARFAIWRGYVAFWRAVAHHLGLKAILKAATEIKKAFT